jgi:integrase
MKQKHGRFFARWWDESGNEKAKSFTTKREAEKFQARIRADVRVAKKEKVGTIRQLAAAWFEGHVFNSKQERWFHKRVMEELTSVAGDLAVRDLTYLIPNALIDKWKNEGYGRASVQQFRFRLQALCEWLEHHGAIGLVKNLTKVLKPQARQITAEPWEIDKLKELGAPWFKCFVTLCLDGGLRSSEACRCSPANYSPEQNKITLTVKKQRIHSFTVTDELKKLFDLAPPAENPRTPYLQLLKGEKVGQKLLYDTWCRIRERGKINPDLEPHDLRRTIATEMYRKWHDLRMVQAYLGHANPITTFDYIRHVDPLSIQPYIEDLKVTIFRKKSHVEFGGAHK